MKDRAMIGLRTTKRKFISFAAVAALGGMVVGGLPAFAAKGDLTDLVQNRKAVDAPMVITMGKADIISLPDNVSDVLVADPSIVDVQAVQSNRLYAVGLTIGDTNIIVLDRNGDVVKKIDLHVSYDVKAIQNLVDNMFPKENVTVGAVHDQILLKGKASTPEVAARITDVVTAYVSDLQDIEGTADELIANLMEVRGEQQVMLQVKIVEAERSVIKELGVDFSMNDPNELAATTLFGTTPPNSLVDGTDALLAGAGSGLALSQDPVGIARGFLDSGIDGIGIVGLLLEALEEDNLINVLAEPNLTAVSGQQAGFLAGGEFPVPAGRDNVGNIVVEFREFGVSLNFKPVVLSEDRISLQLNTEVSSLDNTNAIVLADLTVPGLDIRRAETTIEIPSGGSLMIAGLLQSQTAESLSGLPGVRDTPVLGDLISSDSFRRDESELVVIVTAYTVEPFANTKATEHEPSNNNQQLSGIFAANIRRTFDVEDESMFNTGTYGYIVD